MSSLPIFLVAFVGAFLGSLIADLIPIYIIEPLKNRATHKRIMQREEFVSAWGKNAVGFFIKHDGFFRSGNRK